MILIPSFLPHCRNYFKMTSLVIGTLWWWWEGRGIKKSFFPLFLTHTRAQLWTIKKKTPEVVWEKQCHLLMLYLSPKECSDLPLKLLQPLVETVLFTGQLWRTLRTHHATTSVVQSPSRVWLFATPWTAARQASVPHHLPEFVQVHVHWIGNAI